MPRASYESLGQEPRVWGRIPGYVIRNYSSDLEESVVHHMSSIFLFDEVFCNASQLAREEQSVAEVLLWYRKMLPKQNLTLLALPEDSPGADLKPITQEKIPLAGVNIVFVVSKSDPPPPPIDQMFKGTASRKTFGTFMQLARKIDVFEKFGVEEYMNAVGLSVHPEHRCRGLAAAILEARFALCRSLEIPLTKTLFSSAAAQRVALRCGMQPLLELVTCEEVRDDGELRFPSIPASHIVLIAAKSFVTIS